MANVLYISYDGVLEPLGQSQVLSYLERLSRHRTIHLLSYEKSHDLKDRDARGRIESRMRAAGIHWHPRTYHKSPTALATSYDIFVGAILGIWIVLRHRLRIVHARSYVPAVIALLLGSVLGAKFVFDMRGFWADERVDGGLWPADGRIYRVAKWFERRFLLNADCVVSLTNAAVTEMRGFSYLQGRAPRFEVITTCADLDLFRLAASIKDQRPAGESFVLGYVGSAGLWYLFDETLRFFRLLRERLPNARLHILNRGEHPYIRERIAAAEIEFAAVVLEATDHLGVARAMQQMDAGVFFIKPAYSKLASMPTKLGEFLGCGVPCVGNYGVGDMAELLERDQVGVGVHDFSEAAMRKAVEAILALTRQPDIQTRCRDAAVRHFALEQGVAAYARIYADLADA